MTNIGSAIRSFLLSRTMLTALIGQRMYPDVMPQDATMPSVCYYRFSTERTHDISSCTRSASTRVRFDCFASTRATADDIATAIRLSGITEFTGNIGNINVQGVRIDGGEIYSQQPPTDGNQVHRYVTSFDLMVNYSEGS